MPDLQVIIDVDEGGYTGQRDQWETRSHKAIVTLEDDGSVRLSYPGGTRRHVQFERTELEGALEMLDGVARHDRLLRDPPPAPAVPTRLTRGT